MVGITRRPDGSEDSGYGSVSSASSPTTIERWMASKDKFCIAANGQIPITWLSRELQVNPELKGLYDRHILPHMSDIFAAHGISFAGERLNRLQPKEEAYETKDVISISTRDRRPRKAWYDAANDVLAKVKENVPNRLLLSIQVLVSNVDEMYQDISSALPNDPSIIEPLEQVKDRIVEEVSTSMTNVWSSISFQMRRSRHDFGAPRKPTVIVFCRPLSVCDFAATEDRLLEILNDVEIQVYLEFIPGRVVLANPGFIRRAMRHEPELLPENPVNGSSIGVKGRATEAGTLGGWLTLNLPQEKRQIKCALTCYHVVRSDDPSATVHTDSHGVHWSDQRGRLTIEYPAALDAKAAMDRLDELCQLEPEAQDLQHQRNMISQLMSGLGIGKVLLASGYQVRNNHRLDWALVESPETFSYNKPPSINQDKSFKLPMTGPRYNLHPDAKVKQLDFVKEGDWVVKSGRTTLTSATVSSMKAVTWASGYTTEEIELISEDADVAAEGDSGSFVINVRGDLVGLLFAVNKQSGRFDTAYMTPFSLIQDQIKEMTNGGFLSLD
ncbi:hypothetical protein MaudCBS49596_006075 [Microsporum audouinii]